MTTIVFNTKNHKIVYRFEVQATKEQLAAACESTPNAFAEELQNIKLTELAEIYNVLAGTSIQKFASKTVAVERIQHALLEFEVPIYEGQAKPVFAKLSAGVAKSWEDPAVRAQRSQRHACLVDGVEFPSLQAAYREFDLDQKDHREFRKELKTSLKSIKRHGKTWKLFER